MCATCHMFPRGAPSCVGRPWMLLRRLCAVSSLAAASISTASAASMRFRSWPITEVKPLEPTLRAMGLRLPASQIDGTAGGGDPCLSDALVSVGPAGRGGTGSFVSSSGLIVTNHHVALDAVRRASGVGQTVSADRSQAL